MMLILIGTLLIIVVGIGAYVYQNSKDYTVLAKCLTEKKAVMYGTEWCPHCQAQKQAFGKAWQYVLYVDCDRDRLQCDINEVDGYPTWKIGNMTLEGEQTMQALAQAAGCPLE